MKKLLGISISLLLTLSIFSCKREGCTNTEATNFDKKANTDDGSCILPIDAFIGTYMVTDTTETGGTPIIKTYQLGMLKNSDTRVALVNLNNTVDIYADITNTTLTMIPGSGLSVGSASLSGSMLRLYYTYAGNSIHGTGAKM